MQPQLTREACEMIAAEYTKLRAQETVGSDKAKVKHLCVYVCVCVCVCHTLIVTLCWGGSKLMCASPILCLVSDAACDSPYLRDPDSPVHLTCQGSDEQAGGTGE